MKRLAVGARGELGEREMKKMIEVMKRINPELDFVLDIVLITVIFMAVIFVLSF